VHLLSLEALSRSLHPLIKDEMNQSALKNQAKKVTADCTEMVLNTNKNAFQSFQNMSRFEGYGSKCLLIKETWHLSRRKSGPVWE
jgi:hypothetical protein